MTGNRFGGTFWPGTTEPTMYPPTKMRMNHARRYCRRVGTKDFFIFSCIMLLQIREDRTPSLTWWKDGDKRTLPWYSFYEFAAFFF